MTLADIVWGYVAECPTRHDMRLGGVVYVRLLLTLLAYTGIRVLYVLHFKRSARTTGRELGRLWVWLRRRC